MKTLTTLAGFVLYVLGMFIAITDMENNFSLLADLIRTSVMLGLPAPEWYGLFMWLAPALGGVIFLIYGFSNSSSRNRHTPIRRRGF